LGLCTLGTMVPSRMGHPNAVVWPPLQMHPKVAISHQLGGCPNVVSLVLFRHIPNQDGPIRMLS
jgi:hypothetical protein